jgi:hypothetical protein
MLTEGKSVGQAFKQDLCGHGYEAGDPGKPRQVVATVRRELTPLFLKLAHEISNGNLTESHLNDDVCESSSAELLSAPDEASESEEFKCGPTSSTARTT